MSPEDVKAREREERQAWDGYFAEALANTARYRAATIGTKVHRTNSTQEEILAACAEIADAMLEIRKQRFA